MNDSLDLSNAPGYEFLRPLVSGWTSKIEAAKRAKKDWDEVAQECQMFFSRSSAAMWNPEYSRKFWVGIKPPKFRISINRIFEAVAIFAPNLMFDVPHRTVEPKRQLAIPPDFMQFAQQDPQMQQLLMQDLASKNPMALFQMQQQLQMQMMQAQQQLQMAQQMPPEQSEGQPPPQMPDPQQLMAQMIMQSFLQEQAKSEVTDKLVAYLLGQWLNYTPREQPKNGLIGQSELAIIDALVKGRGVMATRPYKMPQSDQVLTGSFREDPCDLLIDPDFNSMEDGKWVAIRRVDAHWVLERRFKLPPGSLKNRTSLESNWHFGETGSLHRQNALNGNTNDLVVWYEVWSKTGCGARMSGMHMPIKDHLEKVVGDYAYLAICPACPFPLNCYSQDLRYGGEGGEGLSEEEVKQRFSWPIPTWADDRFPIETLDFYPDTQSAWPIAPMSPGLGELKFLNFMIPWAANRIYSSSRDFLAVASPHVDHYTKYLQEGLDQTVIPTPLGVADVRAVMQVLQFPPMNMDVWRIIELVSEMFDKRVGLTEAAYGMNQGGTQSRSAEDAIQKRQAVGIRPDHMRRKVVEWQSAMSCQEAFCARWFVEGKDVEPLMGPFGRLLWEQFVMSQDVQLVTREMKYTVSAASIRRPDRDRDVANLNQLLQVTMPVVQNHMANTGDVTGYNSLVGRWGEYHDMRVEEFQLPQPPPPQPPQPTPQDMVELQVAQLELQGKQIEVEGKVATEQAKGQALQAKVAGDVEAARLKLMLDQASGEQQLEQSAQKGRLDVVAKSLAGQQSLQQTALANQLALSHQVEMQDIKAQQARNTPKSNGKA